MHRNGKAYDRNGKAFNKHGKIVNQTLSFRDIFLQKLQTKLKLLTVIFKTRYICSQKFFTTTLLQTFYTSTMKEKLYTLLFLLTTGLGWLFTASFQTATAQGAKWELFYSLPATYTFHITQEGNMLVANYVWDNTGGIFLSTDQGKTWKKTAVKDYHYSDMLEGNGYVFAAGMGAHIARSADGGQTWEILSYARALEGLVAPEDQDWTVCYTMTFHNDRLFIADFTGGGVLYSDDNGETWNNTDTESMSIELDDGKKGGKVVENIYNLVSLNGKLYAFGVYCVYQLNETDMTWTKVRTDSNFMAVSAFAGGKLYCGRSVMNQTENAAFLEATTDGQTWETVKRPEGLIDNNVRAMFGEGNLLVAAMQSTGIYCTNNGGEQWFDISRGMPDYVDGEPNGYYLSPLTLAADKDFLYVAVYDTPENAKRNASGIYRMRKALLPTETGIETVQADETDVRMSRDGQSLLLPEGTTHAVVYDMAGRTVQTAEGAALISMKNLPKGTYVYQIKAGGRTLQGKFVKGA